MNARGFTLLEMLVALAILSLAALALVRLDAFALRTATTVDGSALARMVAANAATDILTAPTPPAPGRQSVQVTNGGRLWTVTTLASADGTVGGIMVAISVSDGSDRAMLTIVREAGTGETGVREAGA